MTITVTVPLTCLLQPKCKEVKADTEDAWDKSVDFVYMKACKSFQLCCIGPSRPTKGRIECTCATMTERKLHGFRLGNQKLTHSSPTHPKGEAAQSGAYSNSPLLLLYF